MCLDDGDQLVRGNKRHVLQGKLGGFGQERRLGTEGKERALRIWGRCYIRLVLCGLRAITDGEMVGAGNSAISISADAYGGICLASGGGDRGIHGWIG